MKVHAPRREKAPFFIAGMVLLAMVAPSRAEPPWYMGHIHIGEPNAYTRSIPGAFNKIEPPPEWGPVPEEYYHWPTFREALDEYGWFGRKMKRSYVSKDYATYPPAPAPITGEPPVVRTIDPSTPATIQVLVPEQARLWFDDQPTSQTGATRLFVTEPLIDHRKYEYRVRARWKINGQEKESVKTIQVKAGDQVVVKFDSIGNGGR